jgi:hypothetical protein
LSAIKNGNLKIQFMKYTDDHLQTMMTVCLILNDRPTLNNEKLLWQGKAVGIDLRTKEILCDPNYFDEKTYYALIGYAVENEFMINIAPMPVVDNLN